MEKIVDIRPIKKKLRAQQKEKRLLMDPALKNAYNKKSNHY